MKYAVTALLVAIITLGIYNNLDAVVSPFIRHVTLVDRPAPEFFLVHDLEGQEHSLGELRGKTSMIVIWATWCERCSKVLHQVEQLQHEYADQNVKFVTFNEDVVQGNPDPRDHAPGLTSEVIGFRDREKIALPIWLPIGQGADTFGPALSEGRVGLEYKMPQIFILDKNLHVRWYSQSPFSGEIPVALREVVESATMATK